MKYACKLEDDLDEIGTETAMQIYPPFEYTTQKTERGCCTRTRCKELNNGKVYFEKKKKKMGANDTLFLEDSWLSFS